MMDLLRALVASQDDLPQCPSKGGACGSALVVAKERVHHCVADPHDSTEHGCSCGRDWTEVTAAAENGE